MSNEAGPTPNKRLHVGLNAQLLSSESGYRNAGVSQYIHWLMTTLPGIAPDMRFTAFGGDAARGYHGWGVCSPHTQKDAAAARILWEQTALPRQARRQQLDLLHSPVYAGPLIGRTPQVVTLHDLSFYLFPHLFPPARRAYLQRITRETTRRAAAIIAVSASTARDAVEILKVPPDRVRVIPNGVNPDLKPPTEEMVASLRTRLGLPERYILYLGTLEPRKNLPVLIQAYAQARRSGVEHGLVLAGGRGWYDEPIDAALHEAGVADHVLLPGYIPAEDLSALYGGADLFVYPSLYEGFGLPPLEAMACGTPVLTSNVSAVPEIVGHAGVTVNPREPEQMAAELVALLADDERRKLLAAAGLERAALYSWENTARRTASLYGEVAA
jgi:glycosyltransferase involved in cell wall biosynthesis